MNGVDIVWPEFARTLERELAETERLRFGADADRRRLRCELSAAKAECERSKFALVEWEAKERGWSKAVEKDAAELARLRAQLAAIEEDGTEEHNAAVGLRQQLVAALDRAEKAEAECLEQARLLGMSGEREADLLGKLGRLESELAAIKHGHGELGKYEQLRLKNAELQAELANIANAKPATWGDMSDSFQAWAQNRARHALAAMKGTP
jgi:chromosome segregation ATPase